MQLTVASWDDRVFSIELDPDETVATLQAILEAESNVPAAQQQLLHNGQRLVPNSALRAAGVADGDMIMLLPTLPAGAGGGGAAGAQQQQRGQQQLQQQQQQQQQPQAQHNPFMELNDDGSAKAPAAFIQQVRGNPQLMQAIQDGNPTLARAVRNEDVAALQEELRHVRDAQRAREAALAREEELLAADPFDPEAQARIEELIHQKNIEENMAAALENSPEVFGSVTMLYVDMEVHGVPVKSFVDSGAQMTIMTEDFAAKCFLTRLIDKRFQGMAVGVGSSRIVGRIHQAPLKVSGHFITSSITVLAQKDGPQFIFGLDMLRRHQCAIDLVTNQLHFGSCGASLPFLPEHEIPRDFSRHIEEVTKEQAERSMAEAKHTAGEDGVLGAGTAPAPRAAGASQAQQQQQQQPPPSQQQVAAGGGGASQGASQQAAAASTRGGGGSRGAGAAADALQEKVARLVALGFPEGVCRQALQAAGGNEDAAASMLFGDMM